MKVSLANILLFSLVLFYLVMLGGGNYEQLNVTSLLASAPPESLAILQGPYGFNPVKFWVIFRPLTILLFLGAIIFNWRSTIRRKLLLTAFTIDCAITLSTFLYFAPETAVLTAPDLYLDSTGVTRIQLWKNLNWIRLGAFYAASLFLLLALSKNRNDNHRG
ncbi:MAG: hypothetical protein JNL53_14635 [Cyclobacteriaceae bacterium]|nr:hypothetical protein [Cyclobacteriaceae bacterium]